MVVAAIMVSVLDVDECFVGSDLCDSHADCTNTIGSHECTCIVGYAGNGSHCGKYLSEIKHIPSGFVDMQNCDVCFEFRMWGW